MVAQPRQELLEQAIALSHNMAECGARGDWSQVVELESKRSTLLEQAFRVAVPADESTVNQIHAILAADKRLMSLSVEARDGVAAELSGLQRGRKVNQAYRDAGV